MRVTTPETLNPTFIELLKNETERRRLGERAFETLQSQRGATKFTLDKLRHLLQRNSHEAHGE